MLKNFITVALRNFLRQRLYAYINLAGLVSGLVCALIIFLWVKSEVEVDQFHTDADRIYKVMVNLIPENGDPITWETSPGLLADDIAENSADVESTVRVMNNGAQLFQVKDRSFLESGYFCDPSFFSVFNFTITDGTVPPTGIEKNWVAISSSLAKRLFKSESAVGKTVRVGEQYDLTVTTVFQDPSSQSSLKFNFILPYELYIEARGKYYTWQNFDNLLFVKLRDPQKIQTVSLATNDRYTKRLQDAGDKDQTEFYFQPFGETYLYSEFQNGLPTGGRIRYVQLFSVIAIFILVMACINFTNMATARAMLRAKEVGVRKSVGAQRKSLIFQFITESIVFTAIAMTIAIGIVHLTLPYFNTLMGKDLVLNLIDPFLITSIIAIVFITGMTAGSYPAFFLSGYQPSKVLKGTLSGNFKGLTLRKTLVVFQFTLTIILVSSVLIVNKQLQFIQGTNLGFDKEHVLSFPIRGSIENQFSSFKNEALTFSGITGVTRANQTPISVNSQTGTLKWPGRPADSQTLFRTIVSDYDFINTIGLKIVEGRAFSEDFHDSSNFIISKKAVEVMGLKNPVGETLSMWGYEGKIVGVVDDFHSRSLRESIDPVVLFCNPSLTGKIFVQFQGDKAMDVVQQLSALFKKYSPDYPFDYTFMDDDFAKLYASENKASTLTFIFTTMAVIISGLGLLGLTAYTAERKKKEIGIRKTMGASVSSILAMISKDFVILCIMAILIGCPVAYYLMDSFLNGFAYHISIGATLFLYTILAMLTFTLLVVCLQAAKAATANPIEALRNE